MTVRGVLSTRVVAAVALLLCCASPLAAQGKVERKIPLGMDGALRIVNMVGSVVVHGWNKDTVLVRGTLNPGDRFFAGGGYTGAKIFVESENDRDPKPALSDYWNPHGRLIPLMLVPFFLLGFGRALWRARRRVVWPQTLAHPTIALTGYVTSRKVQ